MGGPPPFPILGQALPIELANTIHRGPRTIVEGLRSPDDLALWLTCHAERLWATPPPADQALLSEIIQLREHVRAALIARADRGRPPVPAVTALNDSAEAAPYHLHLRWPSSGPPALTRRTTATPAVQLTAEIAEALSVTLG